MLRVPVTFPPDRFYGAELSAMCVPDLLGTQGTFLLFTTRPAGARFKEGGIRIPIVIDGDRIETKVQGPENTLRSDSRAARASASHPNRSIETRGGSWTSAAPASSSRRVG